MTNTNTTEATLRNAVKTATTTEAARLACLALSAYLRGQQDAMWKAHEAAQAR